MPLIVCLQDVGISQKEKEKEEIYMFSFMRR